MIIVIAKINILFFIFFQSFGVINRNSLFVTHSVKELLSDMLGMELFGHLELDLGSWNCV
jgi:hypothetical protein